MSLDTSTRRAPQARRVAGRGRARPPAGGATTEQTAPETPAPPRLPGRRNPRWLAAGLAALCLGGLLAYVVYARLAAETTVLALTSTVYRGEVVEAADLTAVTVQGPPPTSTVPVTQRSSVVGQRAVFDLPAGSLLGPGSVAPQALPSAGAAVVGLRLPTGRAPAPLLVPSAPVRIVALPPTAGASTSDSLAGKTYSGRVVDVVPGADGTSTVVDVELPADQAPVVAQLGAQERVALVRDAGR